MREKGKEREKKEKIERMEEKMKKVIKTLREDETSTECGNQCWFLNLFNSFISKCN